MITDERIAELAFDLGMDPSLAEVKEALRTAAREAAAAENEACAKVCEQAVIYTIDSVATLGMPKNHAQCAQAIRARRAAGEGEGR